MTSRSLHESVLAFRQPPVNAKLLHGVEQTIARQEVLSLKTTEKQRVDVHRIKDQIIRRDMARGSNAKEEKNSIGLSFKNVRVLHFRINFNLAALL